LCFVETISHPLETKEVGIAFWGAHAWPSAKTSHAPFGVSPNGKAHESARRDAGRGNRDGCAPQLLSLFHFCPICQSMFSTKQDDLQGLCVLLRVSPEWHGEFQGYSR